MSGIDPWAPAASPGRVVDAVDAVRDLIDPAILNHSLRTMHYAVALSDEMRLSTEAREALAVACVLHDVTRKGVQTDFGAPLVPDSTRAQIEHRYPRLDIERVLSGAVVEAALLDRERAPRNSWPSALLDAHLADPTDPDSRLRGF